jgi:hypothetical protein
MSAFESSPVHCLKPLPSGKRRRPAKEGANAMLYSRQNFMDLYTRKLTGSQYHLISDLPPVQDSSP